MKNSIQRKKVKIIPTPRIKYEIEKDKLEVELIKGYKATRKEDMKINKEFDETLVNGLEKG